MPLQIIILSYYQTPTLIKHLEPIIDTLKWRVFQLCYKKELAIRTYKKIVDPDKRKGKQTSKQDQETKKGKFIAAIVKAERDARDKKTDPIDTSTDVSGGRHVPLKQVEGVSGE